MTDTIVYVTRGLHDPEDLKDWCYRNIGNVDKWQYTRMYDTSKYKFWFVNEEDATAFKLTFTV